MELKFYYKHSFLRNGTKKLLTSIDPKFINNTKSLYLQELFWVVLVMVQRSNKSADGFST